MMSDLIFLLKVMAISVAGAIAIKLSASLPTPLPGLPLVLSLVLLPTLIMAGILLWRTLHLKSDPSNY